METAVTWPRVREERSKSPTAMVAAILMSAVDRAAIAVVAMVLKLVRRTS